LETIYSEEIKLDIGVNIVLKQANVVSHTPACLDPPLYFTPIFSYYFHWLVFSGNVCSRDA